MKKFFMDIINSGAYNVDDLTDRMVKCFALGKLTTEELDELIATATEAARDEEQVDIYEAIVDLQHRVAALESLEYPVWTPGYTTRKGEIVRYDVTADGTLDLCQYDGGRDETALGIGAIDGWYLLGNDLSKYGTIVRNPDKQTYTIIPISA